MAGTLGAVGSGLFLLVKIWFLKSSQHGPLPWKGWNRARGRTGLRNSLGRSSAFPANIHTHACKKMLDKIPLKFSLCFGMGRTCRADLQPFYSLRKGGSDVQLMLSDSVHWEPDSFTDWKLNTTMFKKLEARLCFVSARQDYMYVLNGDGQAQGCRNWTCHRTERCVTVACPFISSLRAAVPSSQGYVGRKQPTQVCLSNPVSAGAATEDCHVLSVGVQTWRQDAESTAGERDSNFTLPYLLNC